MNLFDNLEIEALSDDALELVAGGKSSDSAYCCSCKNCSDGNEDGHVCGDPGNGGEIEICTVE